MNNIVESFEKINSNIKKQRANRLINVIAVSKTFSLDHIKPLIDYGHKHFGENKVQEAVSKWNTIKKQNDDLQLHLIVVNRLFRRITIHTKYYKTYSNDNCCHNDK